MCTILWNIGGAGRGVRFHVFDKVNTYPAHTTIDHLRHPLSTSASSGIFRSILKDKMRLNTYIKRVKSWLKKWKTYGSTRFRTFACTATFLELCITSRSTTRCCCTCTIFTGLSCFGTNIDGTFDIIVLIALSLRSCSFRDGCLPIAARHLPAKQNDWMKQRWVFEWHLKAKHNFIQIF